ncbi:MAG: hypothetical protein A2504_00925 [Bdellovibrionales bacterium RIFOXYD12_FULL_39_22]|nr:MAG: hypothetical protein A2385_03545 [Bdellovibrionales bacterium RIFOXYB1_FULL_39_21]OFZ42598.1 MAG: hypothetical protein A2485_09760 [Bdellovibrionales bacterium RIFOXYC12_FULL_39_17]OFZ47134.1 MAG: hypothetical protein A2404_15535 [Bdellovibrionales bacterium RIFOXYC1_FULL_39_130]OFZ75382.1 MAG: hypothetical protein A2560_14310 [Bdellovibrionales bacterium RIFOXYD1_FULL_39_84]OFZ93333.1 MAG: hypothetical protein A2504_00925 [Bdellovibrionales bacterium RIFOXYD12_FULL_39_22]HLE09991.1 sh
MKLSDTDRIVIIGTTGVGKTTLGKNLSAKLNLPFIELDGLKQGPNWVETPDDIFIKKVDELTSQNKWIVDGNYGIIRDIVWPRAQAIIWLDYSFVRIFFQLFMRTIRRSLKNEVLWNGNRETLRKTFFSKSSILLWAITDHPRKKKIYPKLLIDEKYAHVKTIRLNTPTDLADLLKE